MADKSISKKFLTRESRYQNKQQDIGIDKLSGNGASLKIVKSANRKISWQEYPSTAPSPSHTHEKSPSWTTCLVTDVTIHVISGPWSIKGITLGTTGGGWRLGPELCEESIHFPGYRQSEAGVAHPVSTQSF